MTRIFILLIVLLTFQSTIAQFSEKEVLYSGISQVNEVYVSDVNGDSLGDIIACTTNEILLYLNKGNLAFNEVILDQFSLVNFSAARTADINGDSYVDIVASTEGTGEILWYENLGDSSFSSAKLIDFSMLSRYLESGDLNNDGYIDVIANHKSSSGDNVVLYENDGNGNFNDPKFLTTLEDGLGRIDNITPFDIDQDGDLDVFATDLFRDRLWYIKNLGEGIFDTAVVIGEDLNGAQSLNIADYDNDGFYDIVVAARNIFPSIYFISILDQGRFSRPRRLNYTVDIRQVNTVFTADMDNDGDLDICYSDDTGGKVGYFENQGEFLTFEPIIVYESAKNPRSVFAYDLDGDDDLELVYALWEGKEIGFFVNDKTTSIVALNDDIDLSVGPIPSSTFVYINSESIINNVEIEIYSLDGRIVIKSKMNLKEPIDISNLPKGVYNAIIKSEQGTVSKKLIKI